ncbi:MAG: PAS domain-containing protein, partial [Kiritimatiellae bacterium]|nr:PAS domain-containing protein [Kiritimatiellia bacterium]
MPRRKLVWKLLPFYFLVCVILIGVTLFAGRVLWPPEVPDPDTAYSQLAHLVSLGIFSLLMALLGTTILFFIIYRINRTLELTRLGARRFAEGDLEFRLPVPTSEEMGGLAETLNQMAAQLDDRISTISSQRNQLDAVLSSMVEGLVALDEEENILQVNRAASSLLGIQPGLVIGRNLREVIRNIDLHQMIRQTLADRKATEREIVYYSTEERHLQVHCSPLRDSRRETIGALIVFNDITKLRRLERVRRDFVANV